MVIRDWKRPAAIGYALIIFTFVVLGGWSAFAKLDSAVTAPGIIAEENSRKSVQHLEGGIIKEILVREGQHVDAGEVLFRLDSTQAASESRPPRNSSGLPFGSGGTARRGTRSIDGNRMARRNQGQERSADGETGYSRPNETV